MKLKNTILAGIALISAQSFGMEVPVHKPIQYSKDLVLALPTDIKGYLLPFVLQGTLIQMERTIVTMSTTSKQFNVMINTPQVMLGLLNAVAERSPSQAEAIVLAGRLCLKRRVLPVMEDPMIVAWVSKTGNFFVTGIFAKPLSMLPVQNNNSDIIRRLINYNASINANL